MSRTCEILKNRHFGTQNGRYRIAQHLKIRSPDELRVFQLESELTRMMENFIATQTPPLLLVWIGSRDPPLFENATDTEVASAAASVVRKFLNNPLIPVPRIFRHWFPFFYVVLTDLESHFSGALGSRTLYFAVHTATIAWHARKSSTATGRL